jgi:ABC-type nitrate/sulfonate/bicarbonate transport system permease component
MVSGAPAMTALSSATTGTRGRSYLTPTLRVVEKAPAFVIAGLLWEFLARRLESPYVPPLSEIFDRFVSDWLSADPGQLFLSDTFTQNVLPTLARLGIGWVVSVVVSITLGTALGLMPRLAATADPLVRFGIAVPPPALLPLSIALFGLGASMKIFLIAFGCMWPVLLNTTDGVRSIDPTIRATARTLGLSRWRSLVAVTLPAASPRIFGGLRTSLSTAIILVIIAELYASSSGVGFIIVNSQRNFDILGTWSGVLLLGALGIVVNVLFVLAEHRIMRWQIESRRHAR